jgi:hypothetical protein
LPFACSAFSTSSMYVNGGLAWFSVISCSLGCGFLTLTSVSLGSESPHQAVLFVALTRRFDKVMSVFGVLLVPA